MQGQRESWNAPEEARDSWEERPREVAFWTIPLLLTMVAFAIVIVYFSVIS
jgi:hypothetical protein